ncbi:unnamed protein product [Knipowitschia caucasica]
MPNVAQAHSLVCLLSLNAKLVGRLYEILASSEGEDSEGVEIMLGVCASGLLIYRDRLRINRFAWPKILKISYKRNNFYIKIRPGEFEQFESTIGFKLPNHRAAKRLWKVCVEHHTFFRLVSPEAPPKKFMSLGSKFRYSGRTQAQTRRASSQIIRPAPLFERSSSKRYNMSRSLDGAPISENHESLMKDGSAGVVVKGDSIITTVTSEKDEERSEQEDQVQTKVQTTEASEAATVRPDTKSEVDEDSEMRTQYSFIRRVKGENVFIRHSNLMLEDSSTPAEVVKHQTNISELKRSFLETGATSPGLSEWDRRLTSSPKPEEAPMIEPLELQDTPDELTKEEPKTIESTLGILSSSKTSPVVEDKTEVATEAKPDQAEPTSPTTVENGTSTKEMPPVVHTETKTITYESGEAETNGDAEPGVLLSAQTITSESTGTTTTTHITKTVKGGVSETRIEKRIVITGDTDIDHDEALAQAIKEAKEQHPDMSVTKVVVHKETEITPEDGED